jgi:hypothetical protein
MNFINNSYMIFKLKKIVKHGVLADLLKSLENYFKI